MAIYRKWIRLSLRSVLLITTIACLLLGRQAYVHKLQGAALSHIRELGGQMQNDAVQPSMFQSLVNHDGSINARDVTSVAFLGTNFNDSDISEFARCALVLPRLERVMMTDTMVTMNGEQLLREKLPDLDVKVINLWQRSPFAY